MAKKGLWLLFALLAIAVGLYPAIYFKVDRSFGLLSSKPVELLADNLWNIGFYMHIVFGGISLLTGWTQFSPRIRNNNIALHKKLGKVYIFSVTLSSIAAVYIGFFASGGLPASLGFISLGLIWLYTTLKAYSHIRNKQIVQHQKMMIYSYSACFAAVTLRIWLPLLMIMTGNFITAYTIVAWLCWIPNLVAAYLINRRFETTRTLA